MNIQTIQSRIAKNTLLVFVVLMVATFITSVTLITPKASAETVQGRPDTKTGYMLLFSQQAKYNRATIYSTGTGKCAGKSITADKPVTVGISKSKNKQGQFNAAKVKCTTGTYNVYFLKKGEKVPAANTRATLAYTATAVNDNYCSFVHTYGTTRNEVVQNNRCTGDDDPNVDTVEKITPIMTASTNPATIPQGKKFTLTIELKTPDGRALSTEECAGSFTNSKPITGLTIKNNTGEYAFKYNSKTKTCQYVVRVSSATSKKLATEIFVATFKGNRFLNGASTEYRQTITPPETKSNDSSQTVTPSGSSTNANKKAKIKNVKLAKTSPYVVTFTAVVTGLPSCSNDPTGVSIEGFAYDKGSAKPKAIPDSKQPSASQITATPGASGTCNLSTTYTYPPAAKDMNIKHQLVIDSGGKKVTKKSGKITLGR